jgi:hypothetical protein
MHSKASKMCSLYLIINLVIRHKRIYFVHCVLLHISNLYMHYIYSLLFALKRHAIRRGDVMLYSMSKATVRLTNLVEKRRALNIKRELSFWFFYALTYTTKDLLFSILQHNYCEIV